MDSIMALGKRNNTTPTTAGIRNDIDLERNTSNNHRDDDDDMDEKKPMISSGNSMGSAGDHASSINESSGTGGSSSTSTTTTSNSSSVVSRMGLFVLILLAVQNCSKTLLMRFVMQGQPDILTSAAVLGSEFLKLSASVVCIVCYERKSFSSILQFLREDYRNTMLLTVPAAAYNLQMSLEYVALANLNAAMFSVLVQTKLLFTATMAALVLRTKLKYIQVISLVLLTVGVMLCNLSGSKDSKGKDSDAQSNQSFVTGVTATLGIAVSSGFASVYTEKVIKAQRRPTTIASSKEYGLAYTQVQLALMSLVTMGVYAIGKDYEKIMAVGLFHNFTAAAFLSIFNSALGGLIVAAVLKYADSVLKGYATAVSVILTGMLSMVLFGTQLSAVYFLGIINVVTAVLLYNGKNLEQVVCN